MDRLEFVGKLEDIPAGDCCNTRNLAVGRLVAVADCSI